MKYVLLLVITGMSITAAAQKNVIPVSQSVLTGISLPDGSKQDKRFLSVIAGEVLLSTESKKAGAKLKGTEVFYLPAASVNNYNSDSLVNQLTALGWNLIPIDGDDKFVWLQKEARYVIAYFSMDKKQTNLYFAEAETPPAINTGMQTLSTDTTTTQQQ